MSDEAIKPKGLVSKLCEVMAATGYVEKTGTNQKQGYKYATEADVLAMLRKELASRNVFVFPSVVSVNRAAHSKTSGGYDMFITDVMVKWTFLDGDTGETQECMMPGCGTDTGDKGIYKAVTGSSKYLFLKSFMLPTGDDPEDEKVDKEEGKSAAKAVGAGKLRDFAGADTKIILTPYKEGTLAMSGNGVAIIRAEIDNATMGQLGWIWEGNIAMIPKGNYFKFKDLCKDHKIETTLSDEVNGPVKANIPPFVPASKHAPASADPIIEKVEAIERPGKKWFFKVRWAEGTHTSFDKGAFGILQAGVGKPAMLEVSVNGKYSNLKRVLRLDGIDFSDTQEQPEIQY